MTGRLHVDSTVLEEVGARLREVCPRFQSAHPVAKTGKSLVVGGHFEDRRAVAKILVDAPPGWTEKLEHEVRFYEMAGSKSAPVTLPELWFSDTTRGVLILERIDGQPLADERYPSHSVDLDGVIAVLDTLPRIRAWEPWQPPLSADAVEQFRARIGKHVARGRLSEDDVHLAIEILLSIHWTPEFSHGDLLLSNCLFDGNRVTLIDWEFAGYTVPGLDEAQLWTLLMDDPLCRRVTLDAVRRGGDARVILFGLNILGVLAQEIHILRESHIEAFRPRAEKLEDDLRRARAWLRTRDASVQADLSSS